MVITLNLTQTLLTWIASDQFPVADVYRGGYPRVEAAAVAPCAMRGGQQVNVVQQLFARTLRTMAAPQPETCDVIFSNTLYYSNEMTMSHNMMRPYACPLRIREMNRTDKGPKVTRSLTSFKLMGNEDLGVQDFI